MFQLPTILLFYNYKFHFADYQASAITQEKIPYCVVGLPSSVKILLMVYQGHI